MARIRGIEVTLYEQTQTGYDAFGAPTYTETAVVVKNVLVRPVSGEEVIDDLKLFGKHAVYELGIPKGDDHDWKDKKVSFFGEAFRTFGMPMKGIDSMIPLDWNTKVKVERYE